MHHAKHAMIAGIVSICLCFPILPAPFADAGGPERPYGINDTVMLSGRIVSHRYRSRTDESRMEYFDRAYSLALEKSIDVSDAGNPARVYRNITHLELDNYHAFQKQLPEGAHVRIRGTLLTFTRRSGYYRQYFTPVKMRIIEIL